MIVGVIASAVAAYFYVRVIVLMFFTEPPEDAPTVIVPTFAEHRDRDVDRGHHPGAGRACRSRCSTWRTTPTSSSASVR